MYNNSYQQFIPITAEYNASAEMPNFTANNTLLDSK